MMPLLDSHPDVNITKHIKPNSHASQMYSELQHFVRVLSQAQQNIRFAFDSVIELKKSKGNQHAYISYIRGYILIMIHIDWIDWQVGENHNKDIRFSMTQQRRTQFCILPRETEAE